MYVTLNFSFVIFYTIILVTKNDQVQFLDSTFWNNITIYDPLPSPLDQINRFGRETLTPGRLPGPKLKFVNELKSAPLNDDTSDDIPAIANVAMGDRNQTNPCVVWGLSSVPQSQSACESRNVKLLYVLV
jgi:hypothetical protein